MSAGDKRPVPRTQQHGLSSRRYVQNGDFYDGELISQVFKILQVPMRITQRSVHKHILPFYERVVTQNLCINFFFFCKSGLVYVIGALYNFI